MIKYMSKNSPDLLILNMRASRGVGPYRGETIVSLPTPIQASGENKVLPLPDQVNPRQVRREFRLRGEVSNNMHLKHTTEDINLQRDYCKMETLRMTSKKQPAEPSLSKIRVLELENCVILMCEKCGETWNPDKSNSWVCPNGCNKF